jgi:hypothetical protein
VWDIPQKKRNVLQVGAPVEEVLILPHGRTVISLQRHTGIVQRWDLDVIRGLRAYHFRGLASQRIS